MYVRFTYDQPFNDLLLHLREKYPQELFNIEGIGDQLDLNKFSKKFFSSKVTADASIDANANVPETTVITYTAELKKPFEKLNSYYVLWKELRRLYNTGVANDVIEHQLIGDIYIHDMHGIGAGLTYCFNYSAYDILLSGLPMVTKIRSIPPKHLYAFKSQMEQFVTIAANSTLGATGIADFLIVLSYYAKSVVETLTDGHFSFQTEEDVWAFIKETLVSFIYTINQPMRGGMQSPYTNISVYDRKFLEDMQELYLFPDGTTIDVEFVLKLQELFLDIMNEELRRTPVTFPVVTACLAVDSDKERKIIDREFLKTIAVKNLEFGFINIFAGSSSTISSCCRLRSDMSTLDFGYTNSIGGSSTKIGSLGVVSINLPRLALSAESDEEFFAKLKYFVGLAGRINNAKRQIIRKKVEKGVQPLYSLGFIQLDKQYSTVGINGLFEAVKFRGLDILNEDGQQLVLEILDTINTENSTMDKLMGFHHNVEQVPGESLSVKFAQKDSLLNIQDEFEIYSNQFIPLCTHADLLDRIKLQGMFDQKFSGGSILHINVEQRIEDPELIVKLLEESIKAGVVYQAINYTLAECTAGHLTVSRGEICPLCNSDIVNHYTRVVGFLSNTKNWHPVRRAIDFPNRQFYGRIE